jgi:hypothetical protein
VRFPAVVVPAILLLAGTLYYLAKAKENAGRLAESQFGESAHSADSMADERDRRTRTFPDRSQGSERGTGELPGARRRPALYAAETGLQRGQAVRQGGNQRVGRPACQRGGGPTGLRCRRIGRTACPRVDLDGPGGLRNGDSDLHSRAFDVGLGGTLQRRRYIYRGRLYAPWNKPSSSSSARSCR